jgi:ABC-2 type transport system permease protein
MATGSPARLSPYGLGRPRPGARARLEALAAMVRKQLLIMTRYPVEFVTSFVTMAIVLAMFTLATGTFLPPEGLSQAAGSSAAGVVAYGFVLFLFLGDSLWFMSGGLRREQVEGTLEAHYLTPASPLADLLARVLTALLLWDGLLAIVSVAFLGLMLGGLPLVDAGAGLVILIFGFSAIIGIGLVFAAFTLVAKESAEQAASFVQFALLVLCAMFFPFSALPQPVLAVSRLIPLSYTVDLFRSTLIGHAPELAPAALEWWIVVAFGLLMPPVGGWLYRLAERRARERGSLGEY